MDLTTQFRNEVIDPFLRYMDTNFDIDGVKGDGKISLLGGLLEFDYHK